jgi:hypothetical protein
MIYNSVSTPALPSLLWLQKYGCFSSHRGKKQLLDAESRISWSYG